MPQKDIFYHQIALYQDFSRSQAVFENIFFEIKYLDKQ
jgi:hypothetical protein